MVDTSVTIFGNLTKDPDLFDTSSNFRCTFRVASTERRWDRTAGHYVDGATVFISVTCWRVLAENVAGSLNKGDPVVVVGRLRQRSYAKPDGSTVTLTEIDADVVAVDLRRGTTARLRKVARQAPNDSAFDATQSGGDDAHGGEARGGAGGGAEADGTSGIDGADESVGDAALQALRSAELVGAAAEPPF